MDNLANSHFVLGRQCEKLTKKIKKHINTSIEILFFLCVFCSASLTKSEVPNHQRESRYRNMKKVLGLILPTKKVTQKESEKYPEIWPNFQFSEYSNRFFKLGS